MSYPRIAQKLYGEPWAITTAAHVNMQRVFEQHMSGDTSKTTVYVPQNRFNATALVLDPPRDRKSRVYRRGRLAYIPVHGIIGKGLSIMEEMCGGYSIDQLACDLDEVDEDDAITRVLIDFDSPGGQISGVPEAARLIANCSKQTFGFTSGQADSAAYWLMSQCGYLYCTESAEAGSIGVYLAIYDKTKMLKDQGIELVLIKAGKHKAMGLPGNPLTEEQIAMLQEQVDQIYASFTGMIKAKRPNVSTETMQGQAFLGKQIVQSHLADALATSLGDLVARLS